MTTQHRAVMELAGRSLDEILPLLRDDDARVRSNAVRAIRFSHSTNRTERLLSKLDDEASQVRYEAALGIKDSASISDLERLHVALKETTDERVRRMLSELIDDLEGRE